MVIFVAAVSTSPVTPNLLKVVVPFVGAAAIAVVLLLPAFLTWSAPSGRTMQWRMSLPGLAATWSFKDSWATNATVVTAAFTGLFGTKDVTEAILGTRATGVLTLALVDAAVAVGLAGLSPIPGR